MRLYTFDAKRRRQLIGAEVGGRLIDHLAIVVPDTEEALKIWRDRFALKVLYSEVVNAGSVRLTHLDLGNTQLQLVEPLTPDHPLRAWLAKNGPRLHHLCFKVDDVARAQAELPQRGLPVALKIHQGTQGNAHFSSTPQRHKRCRSR